MLKPFWVSWTYIANYGGPTRVMASGYSDAADRVCGFYSDDFKRKASVYVTREEPIKVQLTDTSGSDVRTVR